MTESRRHSARADHHLVCLAEFGRSPEPEIWHPKEVVFVGKHQSGLLLRTGCSSGRVWVTIRSLDRAPATPLADSLDGWDVGQEVTLTITGDLTLISPLGGSPFVRRAFAPERPGLHRVRALARGRARNRDRVSETPSEEYDVAFWAVTETEPEILVGDDGLD